MVRVEGWKGVVRDPTDKRWVVPSTWPLPNVWLGVSVESQKWADVRIPLLLRTPAAVRFLSCEPLLGAVDLLEWLHDSNCIDRDRPVFCICSEPREAHIDWVIVGGESGPGARPMDLAWARTLVRQCRSAGVAPFVKQLGAHPYNSDTGLPWLCRSAKGGDIGEFPADLRIREYPREGAQ
jgi:protein gp37